MRYRITIGKKILAAMISIVVITVLLIAVTTFPKFEKAIADATKNQLMDQVTGEAITITNIMDKYNQILCSFKDNKEAMNLLKQDESNAYKYILNKIKSSDEFISDIVLLNSEGCIIGCTEGADMNIDYSNEAAVQNVLSKKVKSAQSGVIDGGTGKETIMTVVALESDGTFCGAIIGYINYEVFDHAMKECSVTGINNLAAYILDSDGIIFGHTEENKVGTTVLNSVLLDVINQLHNGKEIEKGGVSYEYKGDMKFAGYYVIPNSNWIVCFSVNESEIIGPIHNLERRAYILMILLCIFACVLSFLLTRFIIKPIQITNKTLNRIAQLDFKLDDRYRAYGKRHDETGEMCNSICTVIDNLRNEMFQINSVSEKLTDTAHVLNNIAVSVTKSSEKNTLLISEINETFGDTATTAEKIAEDIGVVQCSTKEMNTKVDISVEKTNSLMKNAENLSEIATKANEQSTKLFSEIKELMSVAMERAKSVEKISLFTEAIQEISEQTKLLALNASIEAATAGDAGRGFAVVANQIGVLAKKSAESADSISELVEEIYMAMESLENCLCQSISYIEEKVIPDYMNFNSASQNYSKDAEELYCTMHFLKTGIYDLFKTMDYTAQSIVKISENITESATDVQNMSNENDAISHLIKETYQQVKSNSELAKELKHIVEKYSLE